jgi:2-polyprenyl-3-methyl-5-hydroxy-6-metoxy-1,4-benzoquinol methylase
LGLALKEQNRDRRVVGVEVDPILASTAARRLDRVYTADLNNHGWIDGLRDERFDVAVFADSLEHLARPWDLLGDVVRMMNSAGVVILSVPNIRHISALWTIFFKGTFPRRPRGTLDGTHLRWFTSRDILELCEDCGLKPRIVGTNLRLVDTPGGRLNKAAQRLLEPVAGLSPIREFLGYQIVVKASKL